ncbi:Fc receptor-like protein 4 [Xenopus laevis]|uniref:Fc receptor-like protein 4 n=1 Tax=Xenopus laevis TaxID=8355 RepID=A0A8J0TMU5_XENLA|nr:Fc receptor-like protein 4 [Xenopus laevis]
MSISCHSIPSPPSVPILYALYKNGALVQGFSYSNGWKYTSAQKKDSGDYTCAAKTMISEAKMSHVLQIQIQDLFSKPDITVSPDWIPEGSAMSIFCHSLPKSETFPLQYALYKNGEMVRGFSHSNEWKFSSARSEDSGDYTCGAKTPTLEKKMSHVLKIQIAGRNYTVQNTVRLMVSAFIFLLASCLVFHHLKSHQQMEPTSVETTDYFYFQISDL